MRQCNLGIALAVLLVTPAAAQLPALGAPRGVARFEIGGDFGNTSDQFLDGSTQPYRAQFSASTLGVRLLPGARRRPRRRSRNSAASGRYTLSLGRASMQAQASVGTLRLGATLGLTSKLSLFGVVPIVRQQIKLEYGLDSAGANAGYNPADPTFGTAAGVAFLDSLGTTVDTLAARLSSGFYYAATHRQALALATYAYLASLDSLYATSPFVPLATSAAGVAMTGAVSGMQTNLADARHPELRAAVAAARRSRLTASAYNQFLTRAEPGTGRGATVRQLHLLPARRRRAGRRLHPHRPMESPRATGRPPCRGPCPRPAADLLPAPLQQFREPAHRQRSDRPAGVAGGGCRRRAVRGAVRGDLQRPAHDDGATVASPSRRSRFRGPIAWRRCRKIRATNSCSARSPISSWCRASRSWE